MIAGITITLLASAFNSCSPVLVATSQPKPVVYTTRPAEEPIYASTIPGPPVQPVVIVPVWAPPYTYVNEVHYYYFPDYSIYYDVFAQNYWYFDGFSWVHVISVPTIPVFVGFNPYTSYIVIMNRAVCNPWMNHEHFEHEYPRGYYNTMYTPRHALGSNTVLRAYDENQNRPLFIDRHSNKEVVVKYDVKNNPRANVNTNSGQPNSPVVNPRTNTNSNNPIKTSRPEHGVTNNNPAVIRDNTNMNQNQQPHVVRETGRPVHSGYQPNVVRNTQVEHTRNEFQAPGRQAANHTTNNAQSPGPIQREEIKPVRSSVPNKDIRNSENRNLENRSRR